MKKKNKKVNAAILIIGNEILSGRTQDKNIAFISSWLNSKCGISVNEVRIVPDSPTTTNILCEYATLSKFSVTPDSILDHDRPLGEVIIEPVFPTAT